MAQTLAPSFGVPTTFGRPTNCNRIPPVDHSMRWWDTVVVVTRDPNWIWPRCPLEDPVAKPYRSGQEIYFFSFSKGLQQQGNTNLVTARRPDSWAAIANADPSTKERRIDSRPGREKKKQVSLLLHVDTFLLLIIQPVGYHFAQRYSSQRRRSGLLSSLSRAE